MKDSIYMYMKMYATRRQIFQVFIWDIFFPEKIQYLTNKIENGMSWDLAYRLTKSL